MGASQVGVGKAHSGIAWHWPPARLNAWVVRRHYPARNIEVRPLLSDDPLDTAAVPA